MADIQDVVSKRNAWNKAIETAEKALGYLQQPNQNVVNECSVYFLQDVEGKIAFRSADYQTREALEKFMNLNWYLFIEFMQKTRDAEIASMKAGIDKIYSEVFTLH